jgi:hypothetical protein
MPPPSGTDLRLFEGVTHLIETLACGENDPDQAEIPVDDGRVGGPSRTRTLKRVNVSLRASC